MLRPKSVTEWMNQSAEVPAIWYLKRLSANDTLATGAHQAGPYIPKEVIFRAFPGLNDPSKENPRCQFRLLIDSHGQERQATAIWYNNWLRGGTRDEARITNLGGRQSVLLDPESTGSLVVFVFPTPEHGSSTAVHVWVARSPEEETEIESRFGPVDPGQTVIWPVPTPVEGKPHSCFLREDEIPPEWRSHFPAPEEMLQKALELRPACDAPVDIRLLERRECEYRIFRSLEEILVLPRIRKGFLSIEDFLEQAQTVLQRRKSRSGRSLELHVKQILQEEGFREGKDFVHGEESDPGTGKRPDFLFPSVEAYHNRSFPEDLLRMLAVKTTCRDRWRQVLNEADRIRVKHLLTLQEGVSETQFREMKDAGVRLVVPTPLKRKFPKAIQPELLSLGDFIKQLRVLQQSWARVL
jgi:hypothetical protein